MIQILGRIVSLDLSRVMFLGLLLCGAYYFFSFKETYDRLEAELTQLKNNLKTEEDKARVTKSTEEKALTVQQNVTRLSQNLDEIQKKLPNNITGSDIRSYIEVFARVPRIQILSSTPGVPVADDIVEKLPLQVQFNATYAQLGSFFVEAAKFPTITTISQYRLTRVSLTEEQKANYGNRSVNLLKVDLTINGYKARENDKEGNKQKK